jgi:anti-sigma B factor antagonist
VNPPTAGAGGTDADPAVEVTLDGELDLATFDRAERLVTAAESTAPPLLVLDLSTLRFIDSTGVRLILQADARARAQQRRLAVRLGTGRALRVFQTLGLLDKLEVLPPDPAPPARTDLADGAQR